MNIDELEMRRARKLLDAFCARRKGLAVSTGLDCRRSGNCLYLAEQGGRELIRLCLETGAWRLYWPRSRGGWEPYPPLAECTDLQRIVEELEQAPLHVHWE